MLILERIRRVKYLSLYDFHQVNHESGRNVMLSQVKMFDRSFNEALSFISLNMILKIVLAVLVT